MKRVLLTGAGGFVGSHILEHLIAKTDWEITIIDSFRHKGVSERIVDSNRFQENRDRVTVFTHDLTAPISPILANRLGKIDYILSIASESHVDRSITDPVPFIQNNVNLVLNLLEYARLVKPDVFLQFSTDEAFGPAEEGQEHGEWDPHIPSNPYAASKAAQEDIAISYWRTFGINLIITNCMNLVGERQDPEKFVPKVIRAVLKGEKVPVHVSPEGVPGSRFYIHCRNAADAILFILKSLPPKKYQDGTDRPDRYNIVGEKELNNLEMAELLASFVGKPLNYEPVNFHQSRPGHDLRYSLDGSKLATLGWKVPVSLEESLKKTVDWTLEHPEWLAS